MDFLTKLCLTGAAVLFAAWSAVVGGRWLARQLAAIRPYLAAFLVFTFVAADYAQKSGTNAPLRGASVELGVENGKWKVENGGVVAVGDSTILHSTLYTLHSISTNDSYSFSLPSNGVCYSNWWLRGAYEDVFRLDLDGLLFPLGTNLCDSLWIYTWGMVGARLGDTSNRVVATGAPMSAVPQVSRFWDAPTTNGSHLLTWENFFLNHDTNTPVSAQLELMPSGDFIARSNLVERLYRRVNPDDWDDDGIPNDDDVDPLAYDGDNFGPHQTLPEGANTNAYCWVDLAVPDANAIVTFTGDGYSALPDPTFIAKAGATNRVILLIGKTYQVASRMPITCIRRSSGEIEVDQVSPTELQIVWPVTIEVESEELRTESGIGNSLLSTLHSPLATLHSTLTALNSQLYTLNSQFTMSVWPDCLGGGFVWTNSCCSVNSLGGGEFAYSCNDACHCGGCSAAGYYGYEEYRLSAFGGWCGCSGAYDPTPGLEDDDGPHAAGASATFSRSAVIFEDGYWNTPGNWVERQSSVTELNCVAHGGPNGGHVRFEIAGEDKLERVSGHLLPVEQDVEADKKLDFTIVYKGQMPSSAAEDIIVTTTFAENVGGAMQEVTTSTLTSVKVELEANASAPQNPDDNRHTYGIAEEIKYRCFPASFGVTWSFPPDFIDRGSGMIMCPWSLQGGTSGSYKANVNASGASYETTLNVLAPIVAVSNIRVNVYSTDVSPVFGEAGHLLIYQDLYATPLYVSFKDVQFREIPDESQSCPHNGYYDDRTKGGNWSHTENDGAGTWYTTLRSGYIMSDKAGRSTAYSAPWSAGSKEWAIPMAWGAGGVVEVPFVPNPTTQKFILQPNGTFKIRKFGHEAERNIYGLIWIDGAFQW